MDLKNKFCISIITKPIPNSTADIINRKKVRDSIFKLSYNKATESDIRYRVIHKNSAVSNRWSEVVTFITKLETIKKNISIKIFSSPICINYKITFLK